MQVSFDDKDEQLRQQRIAVRDKISGPRIGDYVVFQTGEIERFSHDWGTDIQTSPSGSFHLFSNGDASFSGGLNPGTPRKQLLLTKLTLPGQFWFFHHDFSGPHRGVYFDIPCRVFTTTAKYGGFLGKDFESSRLTELKLELQKQGGLAGSQEATCQH